jgi:hypothetical protein
MLAAGSLVSRMSADFIILVNYQAGYQEVTVSCCKPAPSPAVATLQPLSVSATVIAVAITVRSPMPILTPTHCESLAQAIASYQRNQHHNQHSTNTTIATTMSASNLVIIAVISTRVTDKKGHEAALQGKAFERWRGKR